MRKILFGLGLISSISINSNAQDIHFSQYFASPLTLNPAQTGLINRDYRVAANFRNQNWEVSSNPYVTGSISYDMPILMNKLPEGDALGVGVLVFYDKAGSGAMQNLTGGLSFAYHKALGSYREKNHRISIGAQALFVNKSVNFSKLVFGDQLDPRMPDTKLVSNEPFGNQDVSYPDFNVGLLYTGKIDDRSSVYAGGSYFHLTTPNEKFLSSSSNNDTKLNSRFNLYAGGAAEVNPNISLFGSLMYHKQGAAQEMLIGAAVGFILNPRHKEEVGNTVLYLGSWYRFGDALIPYVGLEWTSFQLGFSYDVTTSQLANANKNQGAFELSLIYNGMIDKYQRPKYNFACPKF